MVYDKTRSHVEISATITEAIAAALKNEEDLRKEALPVAPIDMAGAGFEPATFGYEVEQGVWSVWIWLSRAFSVCLGTPRVSLRLHPVLHPAPEILHHRLGRSGVMPT